MATSDPRHAAARGRAARERRRDEAGWVGRLVGSLLLVAVVAAGVAGWRLDLVGPWYDHLFGDPPAPAGPAAVPPPEGLSLPEVTEAPAVDPALAPPGPVDADAVRAAVAPYVGDPVLGRHVTGLVVDLSAGGPEVTIGDGSAAMPASTTKVLTTTAALAALGPETTFTTTVVSGGGKRIVLVGGGDPYLASQKTGAATYPRRADVVTLAEQTAAALTAQGRTAVRLGYDDSLFSGPTFNPAWPAHYLPEAVVSRVTSLWVDEGRPEPGGSGRVEDPSLAAAQAFAGALSDQGITVLGPPTRGVAASGGQELAAVHSAPLREIVQHVLEVSDNEAAEVLSHQVGLQVSGTGSFADGAASVLSTLQGLGVDTSGVTLRDGSGLSRQNRIPPAVLVATLRAATQPDHAGLGSVLTGLPVAGFSGSLTNRFENAFLDARGLVRAKTGTLTGVSSLAGTAVDQQGHLVLFALMADKIKPANETRAQNTLDAAAGALGACRCGAPVG